MCNATGKDHPPDDLDWFKNGNKLLTQYANKVYIRKFVSLTTKTIVSILEIKDATLEDAGMYVCRTSDLQITSARVNVLKSMYCPASLVKLSTMKHVKECCSYFMKTPFP